MPERLVLDCDTGTGPCQGGLAGYGTQNCYGSVREPTFHCCTTLAGFFHQATEVHTGHPMVGPLDLLGSVPGPGEPGLLSAMYGNPADVLPKWPVLR